MGLFSYFFVTLGPKGLKGSVARPLVLNTGIFLSVPQIAELEITASAIPKRNKTATASII